MKTSMKLSPAVEKRIIRETQKIFGKSKHYRSEYFRRRIYETAFHEAGHVVARMFTGHDVSHLISVSIIPDGETLGRESSCRNITENVIEGYPDELKQCAGRILLIGMLAGRAAQLRVAKDEDREGILDCDSEEWDSPGADLFRVSRISSIMARPHMPKNRILQLAEKWTTEMIAIPQVWAATERIAAALLERGTITPARVEKECAEIQHLSFRLPKWMKRLHTLPHTK